MVKAESIYGTKEVCRYDAEDLSSWEGETRAYRAERLFQLESGMSVEFTKENDMMIHIWSNYERL